MTHITPTHTLTASRLGPVACSVDSDCPDGTVCGPDGVCVSTDGYGVDGDPITRPQNTITDPVYVRFNPDGTQLDRTNMGTQIDRSPAVIGETELGQQVREGDTVTLESIAPQNEDYDALEVQAVTESYGPQRARPVRTVLRTEDI